MIRRHSLPGAVLAIALALSASAQAAGITAPSLTGSVEVVGMMTKNFDYNVMSDSVLDIGGGTYEFLGDDLANNGSIDVWDYSWDISANADPFIDSTFTIVNLTGATQTFNVFFNLPVSPGFSPAYKTGVLGFTFTDANSDGGAGVTFNSWDGLIDNVSAMSIFVASVPCSGVGCSGGVADVTNGPLFHAPGVSSSIGNTLNFDLTAGDSVTVHTRFEVTPVPVPASVWLFGSALGLLGWIRRRTA